MGGPSRPKVVMNYDIVRSVGQARFVKTLKPARSRKSLALRMHQVNTGDLQ